MDMSADWDDLSYKPEEYCAPTWCEKLSNIPKTRIKLARLPTPIHKWNVPGAPPDFNIYIKREDLTGCTMSGNKARKLEFLLADAVNRGCKQVITCGSTHSNHARATAAAAAQVGLKCHVLVFYVHDKIHIVDELHLSGNLLLNTMFGSNMYIVNWEEPMDQKITDQMQRIADNIREEFHEECYQIPMGGSNNVGLYGYIECYREMMSQGLFDHISDVVCACGSGGTAMGFALANYLTGSHVRVHGVCVCFDASMFYSHINSVLSEIGVTEVKSEDILNVIEGYVGAGYGIPHQSDLEFIHDVSKKTGIVLDPTYTCKAARGMIGELKNNPGVFKGNNILFMYTGGLFDCLDGEMAEYLRRQKLENCVMWENTD